MDKGLMMKVVRAFNTPARRFSVGTVITPADIDGPMAFDDWVARGFVEADEPVRNVVPVQVDPAGLVYEHSDEPAAAEPEAPFFEDTKE
jgi:hypothetical protein